MDNKVLTRIVCLLEAQNATGVICLEKKCKHNKFGSCVFKQIVIEKDGKCLECLYQD